MCLCNISSDTCIHVQYSALYKKEGGREGGREDTGTQDILVTMMMGAVVGDIGG